MAEFQPRELHLHTLETLIADLVSGRSVIVSKRQNFSLPDEATRSALEWYRKAGSGRWPASIPGPDLENLVTACTVKPPSFPAETASAANSNTKRLKLKKLEAHRFAGLHRFGTPTAAPETYVHEFGRPLTLFEGRNGSGKTSLANAIIWALTGEVLRPQRLPEKADTDFSCWMEPEAAEGDVSTHKLTLVTPLPDADVYRPDQEHIPADTWVELTFEDETGQPLPPLRRTQSRSARHKPTETCDLSPLGIDPIATRIGTLMPGLLGLIKVGHESELGRAVAELTGLSALVDLSDHARRAKGRIVSDLIKSKTAERDRLDESYTTAKGDLEREFESHPSIKPSAEIPPPSDDATIAEKLEAVATELEQRKADAFASAKEILGDEFDASNAAIRSSLEESIVPAVAELGQLHRLPSLARLIALKNLTSVEVQEVEKIISDLLAEARILADLACDPDVAARTQLYARVADWLATNPDPGRDDNFCAVCGSALAGITDPVTGKLIKVHIDEARDNAALLSQTLNHWAVAARNKLIASLPAALKVEIETDLPAHPLDLIRLGLTDELFKQQHFSGVLSQLKDQVSVNFETATADRVDLEPEQAVELPVEAKGLAVSIERLQAALRFAAWRQANDALIQSVFEKVVGRRPKDGEATEKVTLCGKLLELEAMVKAAQPLTKAIELCGRLKKAIESRRTVEDRLKAYDTASDALSNLMSLGDLADAQVNELRSKLAVATAEWRDKIYLGAFPTTAPTLVDTKLGREGELDLVVRIDGVRAPAQQISNASALRASLVAFYLAFWQHVQGARGGISLVLFDDPQELLDDENRERLAQAFGLLVKGGVQVILTSYDPRFSGHISRIKGTGGIDHYEVLPASRFNQRVRTIVHSTEILDLRSRHDKDPTDEKTAVDFVGACREFIEGKLADIFEDPSFSAWMKDNSHPTLKDYVSRLRGEVSRSGPQTMFGSPAFKKFVDHAALKDDAPALVLLNKAHHGDRREIRAGDVSVVSNDLGQLITLTENMWDEASRWRRRDPVDAPQAAFPPDLAPIEVPALTVMICPDLAAFTERASVEGSQAEVETLNPKTFDDKAIYYLRRDNFGFAAPRGSLAIVDAIPSAVDDRRLVIARHGDKVFARRLVRSGTSTTIGLTAETLEPRGERTPKSVLVPEEEVAIHRVVGIIFDHDVHVDVGPEEAVLVETAKPLLKLEVAYEIKDDSAVPLALSGQAVLGGRQIELADLGQFEGRLAALYLQDGSSIFKRVGAALPAPLSHLRQFESIGGLGSSQVLSVGKDQDGVQRLDRARLIFGVLYHPETL